MKKKIVTFLLIVVTLPAAGQELWIHPDKFIYVRTEPVNVKFKTGENFIGYNWTGDKNAINCLELYFDDAIDRDLALNFGNDPGDSLQLEMIDEGTIMLTLDLINSFDTLAWKAVKEFPGQSELREDRNKRGDTVNDEIGGSQTCAKVIFQVGDIFTGTYKKKTDLALEIVPDDNPYSITKEETLKAHVNFMGGRLKNAAVTLWHRVDEEVRQEEYTTNDEGEIKFRASPNGEWMISCVKIKEPADNSAAGAKRYTASLTWGYY